jgi:hypothetical protein
MLGSEFFNTYASTPGGSYHTWERAVVDESKRGGTVDWPWISVPLENGRGEIFVSSDVVSVGTVDDFMRIPLTPIAAQSVANEKYSILPTAKIAKMIWQNAGAKLTPKNIVPNKGANVEQYGAHSKILNDMLTGTSKGTLVSGHKKDVIISNGMKPGKVVIFGWFKPDGSYIQPKTDVHGDFFVDYSHGIRLVSRWMKLDGETVDILDVLRNPKTAGLLSSEGPLKFAGYSNKFGGKPAVNK